MDCRTARTLMAVALDSGPAPSEVGFDKHLAACGPCGLEWIRLRAVDAGLRTTTLVDPPPAFVEGTMERLAAVTHRSVAAPDLRPFDAALVLGAVGAVALVVGEWLRHVGFGTVINPHAILVGAQTILAAAPGVPTGPERVALELAMAGLIAALWSAAVLVPRRPIPHR